MRNKISANTSLNFSQSSVTLGFLALKKLDHKNDSTLQQLDKKGLIHNAELILHNAVYNGVKMVLFISQLSSETLQQTGLPRVSTLIMLGFQREKPAQSSKCTKDFSSEVQSQLPFPLCPPSSFFQFYWF